MSARQSLGAAARRDVRRKAAMERHRAKAQSYTDLIAEGGLDREIKQGKNKGKTCGECYKRGLARALELLAQTEKNLGLGTAVLGNRTRS